MRYLSEIFLRNSQDISGLFPSHSEFLVCLSVCQLAYFLTEIRPIWGYLQFQMRYLFVNFSRHSWDGGELVPNILESLVCLSVCQLAFFLTEFRLIWGYLQFWMKYLSENFWRHSQNVFTLFPNNFDFFMSVSLLVCSLPY